MRDGWLKCRYKGIGIVLGCLFLLALTEMTVHAAENVHFGSAEYQWEEGTVNPIGVYVEAEEVLMDYEVCLTYDPSMLRYVDGASEQDGNTLYLRGTGTAAKYKFMLHFEALQEGDTGLEIVSAVGNTAPQVSVSGGDAQNGSGSTLQLQLPERASITVYCIHSSRLAELSVNDVPLEGFVPGVTEYSLTVAAETERLELSYTPVDPEAQVTVSEQTLEVGENQITLTVRNGEKEQIYQLQVYRQEVTAASSATDAPDTEESPLPAATPELLPSAPEETEESGQKESTAETNRKEPEKINWGLAETIILWVGCFLTGVLLIFHTVNVHRCRVKERGQRKQAKEEVHVINLESTVIKVSYVTMCFKMARDEASSLKEYLIRALKHRNQYSYLTALDDVSFEVKQGDVLGIIGTNGSGKSTMLKIVSGALSPTKGKVEVDRSKVQMLTLGTGFDMELTARENVYLNGSIIGYTREYIDEKYDDIVKFAELEGFMDERMKNFSSGMVSRLGFAIATMRDTPEILILDEILSVGDTFFQKKSMGRIREMIHGGATVLIVSHSMNTIRNNCNRVIWIEKGKLRMDGDAKEVCAAYERMQK